VQVSRVRFRNWSREINATNVLACKPAQEGEVVAVVNWAAQNGYKVRARGASHNWSPLSLAAKTPPSTKVLLVDTTALTGVSIDKAAGTVTAQTGITMEAWLTALEREGLGVIATPAPGDLTLGGVLAIGGHGTGVPAQGEVRSAGHTFGSLSNSILALKAVVWDEVQEKYDLRTFSRTDADCRAFLTHLGRAFIVEVTMQAGPNQNLRCRSFDDIPADEIFAPDSNGERAFAKFVDQGGRIETLWFPFTDKVWLKAWSVAEEKPAEAKEVTKPFNYGFSDSLPNVLSRPVSVAMRNSGRLTPYVSKLNSSVVSFGLKASRDIWGKSKNVLLYVKPSTLRVTANGYAVLVQRENVQRVVNEFHQKVKCLIEESAKQSEFPVNCAAEIRVSGLDKSDEVAVEGAVSPLLSAVRQRPDHPEWNVAVWLDVLTVPGTQGSNKFYRDLEDWILKNYSGEYAGVRVEWSKGWGYTDDQGPWASEDVIENTVPASVDAGQKANDGWGEASAILKKHDPHNLFSSPMLDRLFQKQIEPLDLNAPD
jgi:FAD/FMN-containing dehydrogenase